jgi:hypothetical protein
MPEDFNALEKAVLNWLSHHSADSRLSLQLDAAQFVRREWTGVGFFTHFVVPREIEPIDPKKLKGGIPIHGPLLNSPDIEYGGGSLLWEEEGFVDCLEMYAFGDFFHETVTEFELTS